MASIIGWEGALDAETLFETPPLEEWQVPGQPQQSQPFPSGERLPLASGPSGPGEEFSDPLGSGNPLLDVSGRNRSTKLSAHFTAGEFATSGGVAFPKARIDVDLVLAVEALRQFVKLPIAILNGFYSWEHLASTSRERPPQPTPHLSGRAAKVGSKALKSLELAKAAVLACAPDTSIAIGPASITLAVEQKAPGITSYIDDGAQRDHALSVARTYRELFEGNPYPATDADINASGVLVSEDEHMRKVVHWAIHEKGARDPELLADLAFHRGATAIRYRRDRGQSGRYNANDRQETQLRDEILAHIVKPALATVKAPPARVGGVPRSAKGEVRLDVARPDKPGFDLTGRYETIHKFAGTDELGKTLCINQAGNHLELVMSNVYDTSHDARATRILYRLYGELRAGGFAVFSRRHPGVQFRLLPAAAGLKLEFVEGGTTRVERFWKVSDDPILMERGQAAMEPAVLPLLQAWEWMPLITRQIKHLESICDDQAFIRGGLKGFFDAKGDWDHWKEHVQATEVERFGDALGARLAEKAHGIHASDRLLGTFYLRQFLSARKWRPHDGYPFLSALDWMQRLVSIVEYQCKHHSGRTGSIVPERFIGSLVTHLGLKRNTDADGQVHRYRVSMKLTGATRVIGGYKAELTIEKVDARKWPQGAERFTAVMGAVGASLKGGRTKLSSTYVGYADSAFYWLPNDFPGNVRLALGDLKASVPLAKGAASGGFMHIDGRGGLPVLQVIFSEGDTSAALKGNVSLGATLIGGIGRVLDRGFTDVDYPTMADPTDYTVQYQASKTTHFAFDSALLEPEGRALIRAACAHELAALCARTSRLDIRGYTDSAGTAEYNQALSELRAKNTLQAIRDVMGARLAATTSAQGLGEADAAKADGDNFRNLDRRRVEVLLNGVVILRLRG